MVSSKQNSAVDSTTVVKKLAENAEEKQVKRSHMEDSIFLAVPCDFHAASKADTYQHGGVDQR